MVLHGQGGVGPDRCPQELAGVGGEEGRAEAGSIWALQGVLPRGAAAVRGRAWQEGHLTCLCRYAIDESPKGENVYEKDDGLLGRRCPLAAEAHGRGRG